VQAALVRGGGAQAPASTQPRYAPTVVSVRSIQNGATVVTRAGFSFAGARADAEPIVKRPPGMRSIPPSVTTVTRAIERGAGSS